MAKSKSSKRQAAQKRQQHSAKKAHERDENRTHLPKTGTHADDEYLLRRSREDLVDFGLTNGKGSWATVALVALVVLVIVGLIGWLIITT